VRLYVVSCSPFQILKQSIFTQLVTSVMPLSSTLNIISDLLSVITIRLTHEFEELGETMPLLTSGT
jgi:hypothetical protein